MRAYNSTWDYLQGHVAGEIEAQLRADTSWQRPSWPLGRLGSASAWDEELVRDPLHLLAAGRVKRGTARAPEQTPPELREPLATLGLSWPTTLDAVKTRYKELAKRHHPDANGGDRAAEERLKTINLAYAAVRSRLVRRAQRGGSRVNRIAHSSASHLRALCRGLDFSRTHTGHTGR